jgi:hypothetical protein
MERNSMNNIKDFNEYINSLVEDFKEAWEDDIGDYAHECAAASQYVIYYHRAWELIELLRGYNSDLFYAGEEWAMETFDPMHSSLDNLITSVAYGSIYTALVDALNNNQQEA